MTNASQYNDAPLNEGLGKTPEIRPFPPMHPPAATLSDVSTWPVSDRVRQAMAVSLRG